MILQNPVYICTVRSYGSHAATAATPREPLPIWSNFTAKRTHSRHSFYYHKPCAEYPAMHIYLKLFPNLNSLFHLILI
jgi:hypothetical protein